MGIKDLLPSLESLVVQRSIKDFKGIRVAIDASSWLHKALYVVVEDMVDSGFQDAQLYVDYILIRLNELKTCGIDPVMVFDGRRSYLKSETNSKREEARRVNMENGRRLLDSMRATMDTACAAKLKQEAIACFQRGMAVTHEMEKNVIAALQKLQLSVVVAPYEADPQLIHLCHTGLCQAVLTEDSDVLVYAAVSGKVIPILYKFDKAAQMVQCINIDKLFIIEEEFSPTLPTITNDDSAAAKESNFTKNLKQFAGYRGRRMFVQMCVLAGCDYCDSIHGVGLVTAQQAILRFKHVHDDLRLERVCHYFRVSCRKNVPDTYLQRAHRAEALFHYHMVYNPRSKSLCPFSPPMIIEAGSNKATMERWDDMSFHSNSYKPQGAYASWRGPEIDTKELASLGADTLQELLKDCHVNSTSHLTAEKLCLGLISIKDYTAIIPRFPWDNPNLQHAHQQRISPTNTRNSVSHIWSHRRSLMQHCINLKQQVAQSRSSSDTTIMTSSSHHGSSHRTLSSSSASFEQFSYNRSSPSQSAAVEHHHIQANHSAITESSTSFQRSQYFSPPSTSSTASYSHNPNPFQRSSSSSTMKNNKPSFVRPPLRISASSQQQQHPGIISSIATISSHAAQEIITIIEDEDEVIISSIPSSSLSSSDVCDTLPSIIIYDHVGISERVDMIISQTTPSSDGVINLIDDDDDASLSIYEDTSSSNPTPSSRSSKPPLDPHSHHVPACTMHEVRHPLQPVNLNKRKFVEISIPTSKNAPPRHSSGSSGVKRIKSSCTTMKLPTINSFFPTLSSTSSSSDREV